MTRNSTMKLAPIMMRKRKLMGFALPFAMATSERKPFMMVIMPSANRPVLTMGVTMDPAKQIFVAECEILLQVCVFEIVEQSLPDETRVEGLFGGVGRVGRHYSAFCARGCSA